MKRKVMSRRVELLYASGMRRSYDLAIVEMDVDFAGRIAALEVRPFTKETANVAYFDEMLQFRQTPDLFWECPGLP